MIGVLFANICLTCRSYSVALVTPSNVLVLAAYEKLIAEIINRNCRFYPTTFAQHKKSITWLPSLVGFISFHSAAIFPRLLFCARSFSATSHHDLK